MQVVGMVLHPLRDSAEAVDEVLGWAKRKGAQVLGIETEIRRLNCAAIGVTAAELGQVRQPPLVIFAARIQEIEPIGLEGQAVDRNAHAENGQRAGPKQHRHRRSKAPLGHRQERPSQQ